MLHTKRSVLPALLLSLGMWLAFFGVVEAEQILTFDAVVELEDDGSFVVTETIVYDFEGEARRGIYRTIDNKHAQPASAWYKTREIELELLSVQRNGASEPYRLEEYDGLSVRIGDPEVFYSGVETYTITYRVDGALAVFPEFSEFYWNVTGHGWAVPIRESSLTLIASPSLLLSDQFCYAGPLGVQTPCATIEADTPGVVRFGASALAPYEGLTVAQKLTFATPPRVIETLNLWWLGVLVPIVGCIALGIYLYRWRFKYKYATSIIPQYEPLPDFKPMFTGVLFDGRLDPQDIAAGLVYLAEQGFIKIKAIEKKTLGIFTETDYEVTLLRDVVDVETEFQRMILGLLFGSEQTLTMNSFILSITKGAAPKVEEGLYQVGTSVSLNQLKRNQSQLRENARIIQHLKSSVTADLRTRGYFEQRPTATSVKTILFAVGVVVLMFWLFAIIGVFAFIALFLFLILGMERRTKKGYEAMYYLQGFKQFLSITETERYKMMNAPERSPEQFMEYLPYAIAFGVEKEWAKVFADITIPMPDWYEGTSSASTFNAVAFSSAMSSFSQSFSTSSGSSGSTGGGSSGGGSGGGGGGSW